MKPLTPEQRVLQKFIDYQQEYKDQTKDYAPGNRYWGDKFMTIIGEAKKILNANTAEDEHCSGWTIETCTCKDCNKVRNQIALRKKGEFIKDWYQDWVDKKVAWCPEDPTFDDFEKWLQQEDEWSEHYLDNFMCAFCNHFQIDASDFDMTAFLKDWLQQEDV